MTCAYTATGWRNHRILLTRPTLPLRKPRLRDLKNFSVSHTIFKNKIQWVYNSNVFFKWRNVDYSYNLRTLKTCTDCVLEDIKKRLILLCKIWWKITSIKLEDETLEENIYNTYNRRIIARIYNDCLQIDQKKTIGKRRTNIKAIHQRGHTNRELYENTITLPCWLLLEKCTMNQRWDIII